MCQCDSRQCALVMRFILLVVLKGQSPQILNIFTTWQYSALQIRLVVSMDIKDVTFEISVCTPAQGR